MRAVSASTKLISVLQTHRPSNLGSLWRTHITGLTPNKPGYYAVEPETGKSELLETSVEAVGFFDDNITPPFYLAVGFFDDNITPPFYFFDFGASRASLDSFFVEGLVCKAVEHRKDNSGESSAQARRLLNERYDRCPGLTIDAFGNHFIVAVASKFWLGQVAMLVKVLRQHNSGIVNIQLVDNSLLKRNKNYLSSCLWGDKAVKRCTVIEHDCTFHVTLNNGISTGLFLDQTQNRRIVAQLAQPGSSMLNLFAYTCSFSVVAAKLSDYKTTSVDISRRFLDIGQENFRASGVDLCSHNFANKDVLPFLIDANKKGVTYDVVLCDPPTLFNALATSTPRSCSRKAEVLSCNKHYDQLVSSCAAVVSRGGFLVLFCNSKSLRKKRWIEMIHEGLLPQYGGLVESLLGSDGAQSDTGAACDDVVSTVAERSFEFVQFLGASSDYRESSSEPDLKGIVLRKVN